MVKLHLWKQFDVNGEIKDYMVKAMDRFPKQLLWMAWREDGMIGFGRNPISKGLCALYFSHPVTDNIVLNVFVDLLTLSFYFQCYCDMLAGSGVWRGTLFYVILIAGMFTWASSKGAHGSQSDDRTYPCAVVFTSPLTNRLCSQLKELKELPASPPQRCGLAQK